MVVVVGAGCEVVAVVVRRGGEMIVVSTGGEGVEVIKRDSVVCDAVTELSIWGKAVDVDSELVTVTEPPVNPSTVTETN